MNKIPINHKIFNHGISLKALGIIFFKGCIQKQKTINTFELRKEFKNGETSIASGLKELEHKHMIFQKTNEDYEINNSICDIKDDYILDSDIYKEQGYKLGELGMYFFLQYLAIKEGDYNNKRNFFVLKNQSLETLESLLSKEGRYSIRKKLEKLIKENYLSRYPVYVDGSIKHWNMIVATQKYDLRIKTATIRNNPTPGYIKDLNKTSNNKINDPYLKYDDIFHIKIKYEGETFQHIMTEQELKDFELIFQ